MSRKAKLSAGMPTAKELLEETRPFTEEARREMRLMLVQIFEGDLAKAAEAYRWVVDGAMPFVTRPEVRDTPLAGAPLVRHWPEEPQAPEEVPEWRQEGFMSPEAHQAWIRQGCPTLVDG